MLTGRTSAMDIPAKDLVKFSKLFENDLTLDSLSYQQLLALCKLMRISTIGSSAVLNFQLRMKLRDLKVGGCSMLFMWISADTR
jgi:LETM1 and EF-hand domain-containing protein 1